MTPVTVTVSPIPNFRMLSTMPLGTLLHHIVEQDAPGTVPLRAIEDAAAIQRQLIVISAFKRDLRTNGPLAAKLSSRGKTMLPSETVSTFLGPVDRVLAAFAKAYLRDTHFDFSQLLTLAMVQQNANTVPDDVPTIGIVLSSPSAALGADGRALFDRDIVRAALIVSACLQALIPGEPRPLGLEARPDMDTIYQPRNIGRGKAPPSFDLGFAVRSAQQIANSVLTGRQPLDHGTRTSLIGYLQLAERRFRRDGYTTFAGHLTFFRQKSAGVSSPGLPPTLAAP